MIQKITVHLAMKSLTVETLLLYKVLPRQASPKLSLHLKTVAVIRKQSVAIITMTCAHLFTSFVMWQQYKRGTKMLTVEMPIPPAIKLRYFSTILWAPPSDPGTIQV